MKLFFRDECLGEITALYGDQPWWLGTFSPTPEAGRFADFFAWMVDEEKNSLPIDPPFDPAWWDDENWFVEDAEGRRHGIWLPAIHGDGEIGLRYR